MIIFYCFFPFQYIINLPRKTIRRISGRLPSHQTPFRMITPYLEGTLIDITKRKEAEKVIRVSEARLRRAEIASRLKKKKFLLIIADGLMVVFISLTIVFPYIMSVSL